MNSVPQADADAEAGRRAGVGGALLLATGIGVGAFGAHVLKARLEAAQFATLQTGVQYQFVNALGLLALGALARAALAVPARLVLAGTLLFSLSLYALALGAPRWLGAITPFGGVAMIAGWLLAARALWRRR